jgi:broad specificity phosphatase PhoE
VTLLLVRHAHAGVRRDWNGDDRTRPLTERGAKQARLISRRLLPHDPKRIYSSPAVRCRQTVEPLGEALGIEVEDDPRLFEGPSRADIDTLLDDVARKRTVVLCSHGDVIPALLHGLVERGMTHEHRLVWQKASTWVVDYSKHEGWGAATYLNPPRGL